MQYLAVYLLTSVLLTHSCGSTCNNIGSLMGDILLGSRNLADDFGVQFATAMFSLITLPIETLVYDQSLVCGRRIPLTFDKWLWTTAVGPPVTGRA